MSDEQRCEHGKSPGNPHHTNGDSCDCRPYLCSQRCPGPSVVTPPAQDELATLKITTYGGGKTVQHWQLHYGDQFLADTSIPEHVNGWRELIAAAPSVSTDRTDDLAEVTKVLHKAAEYVFDYCDHGKYSGGAQHGEPYSACDRLARALLDSSWAHEKGIGRG